jgi:hypothetical protein
MFQPRIDQMYLNAFGWSSRKASSGLLVTAESWCSAPVAPRPPSRDAFSLDRRIAVRAIATSSSVRTAGMTRKPSRSNCARSSAVIGVQVCCCASRDI